jgi:hypothetical protein
VSVQKICRILVGFDLMKIMSHSQGAAAMANPKLEVKLP